MRLPFDASLERVDKIAPAGPMETRKSTPAFATRRSCRDV